MDNLNPTSQSFQSSSSSFQSSSNSQPTTTNCSGNSENTRGQFLEFNSQLASHVESVLNGSNVEARGYKKSIEEFESKLQINRETINCFDDLSRFNSRNDYITVCSDAFKSMIEKFRLITGMSYTATNENTANAPISYNRMPKVGPRLNHLVDCIEYLAFEGNEIAKKEEIDISAGSDKTITYNRWAVGIWERFAPIVRMIKKMRKFPNLREISDEFIMSDLILIVSATILFHICMETSNSVIETGGNAQKPINYLLLLPPYGRLYVDNKLGFGADVLENLEELERLVIKTNSLLYIASPFWILFHQFISIDKINICRGIGIKLFEEEFGPILDSAILLVKHLLELHQDNPNFWQCEAAYILYRALHPSSLTSQSGQANSLEEFHFIEEELRDLWRTNNIYSDDRLAKLKDISSQLIMDADKFYDLALNFSRDKLLRALLPPLVAPRIFRLFVSPSQCIYDTIIYWALNSAGRSQMGFFTMIYKQFVGICKALKAFWQE